MTIVFVGVAVGHLSCVGQGAPRIAGGTLLEDALCRLGNTPDRVNDERRITPKQDVHRNSSGRRREDVEEARSEKIGCVAAE